MSLLSRNLNPVQIIFTNLSVFRSRLIPDKLDQKFDVLPKNIYEAGFTILQMTLFHVGRPK